MIQQLETLLNQKFSREPGDIFAALERASTAGTSTLNAAEQFTHLFRIGDWPKIREELAAMPPALARKIYDKMLADLTEKQKPNVRLDDVLSLADAAPEEFTSEQIRRLGQLLGLAVPANESYWLADRLKRGTEKLGGTILRSVCWLGVCCSPEASRIWRARRSLRWSRCRRSRTRACATNSRHSFPPSRRARLRSVDRCRRVWDENLRVLVDPNPKVKDYERTRASQAIAKVIAQVQPARFRQSSPNS